MKRVALALLLVMAPLIMAGPAGCGFAPTAGSAPARPATGLGHVDGQAGGLRLLGVSVAAPGPRGSAHLAGDSAALLLTIVNDGAAGDELTLVSTGVARQVVLRDGDAASPPLVVVPAGGAAILREVTGPHLELTGLRETLRSGSDVLVTFGFRIAGPVTLTVPVRTYADVPVDRVPQPAL